MLFIELTIANPAKEKIHIAIDKIISLYPTPVGYTRVFHLSCNENSINNFIEVTEDVNTIKELIKKVEKL